MEGVSTFLGSLSCSHHVRKQRVSEVTLARRDFFEIEVKLDELVEKVCEYSNKVWYDTLYLSSNLKDEVFLWKRHRTKIAKSNCWIYQGGPTYYFQYWREMEAMTNEMINTLTSRHEYLFNEVEKTQKFKHLPKTNCCFFHVPQYFY